MAHRSGSGWMRELSRYCSFVPRPVSALPFVLIQRDSSAAAKLLWPSSRWATQFFRMAAGDLAQRIFWSGSKKKTEPWRGGENSKAARVSKQTPKLHRKGIPAGWMRLNREQEKPLTRSLDKKNPPPLERPG